MGVGVPALRFTTLLLQYMVTQPDNPIRPGIRFTSRYSVPCYFALPFKYSAICDGTFKRLDTYAYEQTQQRVTWQMLPFTLGTLDV